MMSHSLYHGQIILTCFSDSSPCNTTCLRLPSTWLLDTLWILPLITTPSSTSVQTHPIIHLVNDTDNRTFLFIQITPIGECQGYPDGNLYRETTTNKTFPYTNLTGGGVDINGDGKMDISFTKSAALSLLAPVWGSLGAIVLAVAALAHIAV
jgi:hypothetical protein